MRGPQKSYKCIKTLLNALTQKLALNMVENKQLSLLLCGGISVTSAHIYRFMTEINFDEK